MTTVKKTSWSLCRWRDSSLRFAHFLSASSWEILLIFWSSENNQFCSCLENCEKSHLDHFNLPLGLEARLLCSNFALYQNFMSKIKSPSFLTSLTQTSWLSLQLTSTLPAPLSQVEQFNLSYFHVSFNNTFFTTKHQNWHHHPALFSPTSSWSFTLAASSAASFLILSDWSSAAVRILKASFLIIIIIIIIVQRLSFW